MSEAVAGLLETTYPARQTSADIIKWIKKNRIKILICSVLLSLIGIILYLGIALTNSNTELPCASRHIGSKIEVYGVSNDFLIDPKQCNPNNCITRKENITVEHIPYESRTCEESSMQSCVNSSIKNSTCYYCNNTCLTKDDLADMERINCIECPNKEFKCCLVSKILTILTKLTTSAATNLTTLTHSAKGKYKCYKVDTHELYNKTVVQPLLECPFGLKGERCQEQNTQEFTCKCYTYKNRFPNQDQMPECNKKPNCKTDRISKCFMSKKIDGVQRKCLCTNEKVHEASNKDSSENHHTR